MDEKLKEVFMRMPMEDRIELLNALESLDMPEDSNVEITLLENGGIVIEVVA